jgi:hypothetical protein
MALDLLYQVRAEENVPLPDSLTPSSIPLGALAILILVLAMPGSSIPTMNRQIFARLDIIGAVLSVGWLIPLLFALEEGGGDHAWSSSVIIGTLTAGLTALILFLAFEAWVDRRVLNKTSTQEPIFPVRFLRDPVQGLFLACVSPFHPMNGVIHT